MGLFGCGRAIEAHPACARALTRARRATHAQLYLQPGDGAGAGADAGVNISVSDKGIALASDLKDR